MQTQEELIKEGNQKANELFKTHQIENSPMLIIEQEGEFWGVIGKYKLTEKYKSYELALQKTTELTWDNIIKIIMVIQEMNINFKSITNEQ